MKAVFIEVSISEEMSENSGRYFTNVGEQFAVQTPFSDIYFSNDRVEWWHRKNKHRGNSLSRYY